MNKRSAYQAGYEFGKAARHSRGESYPYEHDYTDAEPQQIRYADGYRDGWNSGALASVKLPLRTSAENG